MLSLCAFALLCGFSTCSSSPSQCCSSPLCPAVRHNSHVFSDAPIPRWFGRLFVMCSPAIITLTPASQLNPVLWSIQQQCVYTVARTQHPGGFPPAGAIKGAAHRRCDCRAYSREGSGRNGRENIWAWGMEWLLGYGVSQVQVHCNFTEMGVWLSNMFFYLKEKEISTLWFYFPKIKK